MGLVYIPVEEGTGDYYGGHRPGNNLFSQSLVALDAATGKRVWYFQLVHHDIWDLDPPDCARAVRLSHCLVAWFPAVAQATKQGSIYAFDRRNGKPIWPIEERPVPASVVPGEKTCADPAVPDTAQGVCAAGDDRRVAE